MDKSYWRLKKREQREKAKGGEVVTVNPIPLDKKLQVSMVFDREKFPDKKAFEIAVERVSRAQRYAQMFPGLIRTDDAKYQTIEWQYENEGVKASQV
jgi:hypothetical protein